MNPLDGPDQARALVAALAYFVAATLFLLGLSRMASPVTARSGIRWAGAGMLIATAATFLLPGLHNIALILVALALGTGLAWVSGKRVAITDMPQMVALYNGMGGGSAAAIGNLRRRAKRRKSAVHPRHLPDPAAIVRLYPPGQIPPPPPPRKDRKK